MIQECQMLIEACISTGVSGKSQKDLPKNKSDWDQ